MDLVSGTYFKHKCEYQLVDYSDPRRSHVVYYRDHFIKNDLLFLRPELCNQVSEMIKSNPSLFPDSYSIVLHNSDINFSQAVINDVFKLFPNISKVFTQNLLSNTPNVYPIPIGIANPKWSHGNVKRFKRVSKEKIDKNNNIYVNFNINTNRLERLHCLNCVGVDIDTDYPNYMSIADHNKFVEATQTEYLRDIKRSYFVVSPDGNGKDCHKTWESLYMGAIPIVTDSVFARRFVQYGIPIEIIDDWASFDRSKYTQDYYNNLWRNFNPTVMNFEFFVDRWYND